MKKWMMIAGCCIFLAGCGSQEEQIHVSGEQEADNEKVESILREEGRINSATAVFVNGDLLIGVEVKPFSRWSKAKIEEELAEKMKKAFPNETVTLSTDLKILWETEKLDEIKDKGKLHDKVKTIKSLSKEET